MNIIISKISGAIYRRAAKPLLFRAHPDPVHDGMIRMGTKVQKSHFLFWLIRKSWAYENDEKLSQELLGLTFKNPLGLSAGLDKNFEIALLVRAIGMGQMEGGSISFKASSGNPKPWFHRLKKTRSIVVNVGLANHGADTILKRIARYDTTQIRPMNLNISVAKTNNQENASDTEAIEDYVGTLQLIKKAGVADLVTLNISCPNAYGGEPFTTSARLDKLLTACDKVGLKCPLFVKMPSDKTDAEFSKLLDVILQHKVAGVTISNLFKSRETAELADDLPDSVQGNLSGRPLFQRSNELIKLAYEKCGDKLVISGVGGIFSAQDAYTKIRLGASLVELITALMFEGPQIVGRINHGLVKLLGDDGYGNVADAVGVDTARGNVHNER